MRAGKAALAVATITPLTLLMLGTVSIQETAPAVARADAPERRAAPRPHIVSRPEWGADDEAVRERRPPYAHGVRAVFIHHTNHPNEYDCDNVPGMLRALQADHIQRGWDDVGYNFIVDRCGTIYEGRRGAMGHAVKGAHTKGFNTHSLGIAALGTFDEGVKVPKAMLKSIAAVTAWKLRRGINPRGRTKMTSTSDESRYPRGDKAKFNVISGHRDAYDTDCPGKALYKKLPLLRKMVANAVRHHSHGKAGKHI
ncbi:MULTISPECIES: peptidoglycan recognition protein [unclassified Streptomyces]|uniref:peptidoglycan recognition protein family protein n=1 Tax=unclassified Streptomyces TaxID=2593676 RepID=UPI002DDA5257|nr:peptidoglycan recognition protein [Streptomyces sp. NBC_01795]WSA91522.1 peptidoglycan recognition protein [Streptomyces sp. NBC_01795]WSS44670.1 peptidoglycan recognition protein [Streptomyces sp. NBC_01187]